MQRPIVFLAVLAAALGGCAAGNQDQRPGALARVADPGAVVATEIAFARAVQQDGQWTAFRRFATEDAWMFVPEPVQAQAWLKDRADPEQPVRWQAHKVWTSCDGSLAITSGAAQWPGGANGIFLTVWERQQDGTYRWEADLGGMVATPDPVPESVTTQVASCSAMPANLPGALPAAQVEGHSRDRTLHYVIQPHEGGRTVRLALWDGTRLAPLAPLTFAD